MTAQKTVATTAHSVSSMAVESQADETSTVETSDATRVAPGKSDTLKTAGKPEKSGKSEIAEKTVKDEKAKKVNKTVKKETAKKALTANAATTSCEQPNSKEDDKVNATPVGVTAETTDKAGANVAPKVEQKVEPKATLKAAPKTTTKTKATTQANVKTKATSKAKGSTKIKETAKTKAKANEKAKELLSKDAAETSDSAGGVVETVAPSNVANKRSVMTAEVPEATDESAQVFGDTPIVPVRPAPCVKVKKSPRSASKKTVETKENLLDDKKEVKDEKPATAGLEQLLRPASSKSASKAPSKKASETRAVEGNDKAPVATVANVARTRKKSASVSRSRAKATTKAPCPSREVLVAKLKPLEDSPIERVGARSGLSLEGIVPEPATPDGLPVNRVVHLQARNQTGRPRIAAPLVEKTKAAQRLGHGLTYGALEDAHHDQVLGETLAVVKAYEASLKDAAPALAAFIDKTLDPNHPAHRAIVAPAESATDETSNVTTPFPKADATPSESHEDPTDPARAEATPPQLPLRELYATPSPETYRYYVENMRYWEEQAAVGAPLLGLPEGDRAQIDAPAPVGDHGNPTTYADVKAQHQQGTTLGGLPIPRASLVAPVPVRPTLWQRAWHVCSVVARSTPDWIGSHTQSFPQSVMTFTLVGGVVMSIVLVMTGFVSGVATLYEKLFFPPVPTFYVVNERRVHDIATLTALAEKAQIPTGRHALRLSPNANDATALSLAPFSTQFDAALRKVSASIAHPLVAMTALVPTHDTVVRDMTPDVLWTLGLESVNPEHLTSLLQAKATLGAKEKAQPYFDFSLLSLDGEPEPSETTEKAEKPEKTKPSEASKEDIAQPEPLQLKTTALPPDYTPPPADTVWEALRAYFPSPSERSENAETARPQPSHSSMVTPKAKGLIGSTGEIALPTATRDKPGG